MKRFSGYALLLLCMLAIATCKKENPTDVKQICKRITEVSASPMYFTFVGPNPVTELGDSMTTDFTYNAQGLLDTLTQSIYGARSDIMFTQYNWLSDKVTATSYRGGGLSSISTYSINSKGLAYEQISNLGSSNTTNFFSYNSDGYLSDVNCPDIGSGAFGTNAMYTYNAYGLVDTIYSYGYSAGDTGDRSLTSYSYTYLSGRTLPFSMYNDASLIAFSYPSFLGKGYNLIPVSITAIEVEPDASPRVTDTTITKHNYTFDQLGRISADKVTVTPLGNVVFSQTYQLFYEYY